VYCAPLLAWLGKAGVATIDLTDVMAEEVERRGINQVFSVTHYSSLADRLVVEHLMRTLPSVVPTTCSPG